MCSVLDVEKEFGDRRFDCAISQRCLINLPTWEYQKRAITQVHRLLNDEGIFLLSEGFQENLDNVNSARAMFALPEIKVVDYNRNLLLSDFEGFIQQYFDVVEKRSYGTYLFLSRVYHPLVVSPESPKHDSKLNEVAMEVTRNLAPAGFEKYSYNLFYVLRKKVL